MSDPLEAPVVLMPFVVLSEADFVAAARQPRERYSPAIAQATKMPAVDAVQEMYRRAADRGMNRPSFEEMLGITREIMFERYALYAALNSPGSQAPS